MTFATSLFLASAVLAFDRYQEAPMLKALVDAGELPPVEERLPEDVMVVNLGTYGIHQIGHYGGTLRFDAVNAPGVQGFTDLTVPFFDSGHGKYLPLVFKGYEVTEDFRSWTFLLRKGLKWSDGHPFTSEDIIFWKDACALNLELTPVRPKELMLDGKLAVVEALDPYRVRFTFEAPNITYLRQIGRMERSITGCPKHYLTQFHPDYTDEESLRERIREAGMDTWTQLWEAKMDRMQNSNPEVPSLLPWIVKDGIPENPTRFVRNPYYYAVDEEGRQLPYADEVLITLVGNSERMKLRKVSGSVSVSNIQLDTAELVRRNAEKGKIKWHMLPPPGDINSSTLCFNFVSPDPFKSKLLNDKRFRIAMSLQMPRDTINEVVYNGLTSPMQIGVSIPDHPWYNEALATAYLEYDLDEANRLLDEIGLTERDEEGFRLGPDGERIIFALQTIRHPEWSIICEIINEEISRVGLQANVRLVGGEGAVDTLREARWDMFLLQFPMGYPNLWPSHMENVRPSGVNSYVWMEWLDSDGVKGEEPPPLMKECWDWWQRARSASNYDELTKAIQWLQGTAAEHLFAVGILSFPPQLRVHAVGVHNVPEKESYFLRSALFLDLL